ncbi:class I SAM-dependent methyltransferase [Demequina lignilytica]|uniref:Class I SAM-dependent methyltransferase n=1 Tax=Demequina lignilytica TaxID=3051663 RepID=A0AB35MGA5_9MICO|nr:class I SAM-dependent methyltransferase [Demequina sp. SYSU T0a273]MDN4482779.1 class I SAM-dependent methyltransferase [Demequina sp. SYSU T0a273]
MTEPAPVDGVAIGWDDARAANRANWDERVALHVEAYGLDRYREDPAHLSTVVRKDLATLSRFLPGGSIGGLDVCHLQCHIGTDTISLARAGAAVVGVDFSAPALAAAAGLATSLGIEASWVEGDVLDARALVSGALGADRDFDVVYTSIGTIGWLRDLDAWARQVAALLRPGGVFYIRDGHPVLFTLDEARDELVARYRYFHDGLALQWDEAATYVGDGTVSSTRTYEWVHPISEVITALIGAGLTIEAMEEGRDLPWRFAERMVELPDGDFAWPGPERDLLPSTFTLVARRPGG